MTEISARVTLSERDEQLLLGLSNGLDNRALAEALHVSGRTVKQIVHDLCLRTHTSNRTQLVAFALRRGLIT